MIGSVSLPHMTSAAGVPGRTPALVWELPIAVALGALSLLAVGITTALLPLLYLAAITPALFRIDLVERRLPNRLVVPGLVLGVVALWLWWATTGSVPVPQLVAAAGYGLLLLGLYYVGGMGAGDVKLGTVIGLASWTFGVAIISPLMAFLIGGCCAAVVLATRGRGATVAFGPFLLAGFWCAVATVTVATALTNAAV